MTKVVVVVNCVSGVAHSYIARNAILGGGKKRGLEMAVEIQGTLGFENKLTAQQIADAEVAIITRDLAVREPNRFKGKKILSKYYSRDLIRQTEKILDEALAMINTEAPPK